MGHGDLDGCYANESSDLDSLVSRETPNSEERWTHTNLILTAMDQVLPC